ncbi:hypothetical protein ACTMMU_15170 [Escherichia coli]
MSFSKSGELHDTVIGHYRNIKHDHEVGVITPARYSEQSPAPVA